MPRGARLDAPGTLHHVMIRGLEKGLIFIDDYDRQDFVRRLGIVAGETATAIFAYALMGNHVHILLKSGPLGMSTFMRRILSGYAQYYNRRHKRVGYLFQNRYKSVICEEDAYFRKLVAYIHLNPLRGGLVASLRELDDYPWCSHAFLTGAGNGGGTGTGGGVEAGTGVGAGVAAGGWYRRDSVLGFFGTREGDALRAYVAYLGEELHHDRESELNGGGLVRSMGGWSKVCSMRRHGDRQLSDERILGSGDFVKEILDQAEERVVHQMPMEDRLKLLQQDIEAFCGNEGITVTVLRGGGRNGTLPELRATLAAKLVNDWGLTFAETARQLGVTTAAVSNMIHKKERRAVQEKG